MNCQHIWKVESKDILPSGLEQARSSGYKISKANAEELTVLTKKDCLVIKKCEKCDSEKVERI